MADFAAGHGYSFSVDDVSGELSESQLEGVTGGLLSSTSTYTLSGSTLFFKF